MTTTAAGRPRQQAAQDAPAPCAFCAAPLEPDQEWCLECGVARTVVHGPPDWRIPALLVGGMVVAAVVAFIVAIANLGDAGGASSRTSSRTRAGIAQGTGHVTGVARAGGSAAAAGALPGWPAGLSGWTVELAALPDQPAAESLARALTARGLTVGVLDSSRHPHMHPGEWVVFSHRYALQTQAEAAAARLLAAGQAQARAVEVAPPGGI
jgi:hypothetical protein